MKSADEILSLLPERNLLDNDLYKFTMMWFVMNHFPDAFVRYEFVDRKNYKYPQGLGSLLRKRIDTFRDVKLNRQQRHLFQKKCGSYLPNLFFDFLEGFRLDPSEVSIFQEVDGTLRIHVEGFWYRTILWEIILMSEISEINFLMTGEETESREELKKKNIQKANKLRMNAVPFVDFGTRRRYSFENQKNVVKDLIEGGGNMFIGSSNVLFAIENDVKIIGTFAHESISAVAAMLGYSHANKHMMELWVKTYGGNLGIVLTDTFGLDAFLKDFDAKYARLFDGVRHDSGDPYLFADKIIEHYKKIGIDPMSKTIVFSDGLDVETSIKLADYCRGKIKTSFGIGTHLTNDVGVKALNIVIKLFMINGMHVIKLSDDAGKHTGDKKTIEIVKELINYKPLSV